MRQNLPMHAPPRYSCPNCGTVFGPHKPNFCGNCGQDTRDHPPSLWEFVHEFITHYVALEGKFARTLGLLLFRPGTLTAEYLAGRKVRYIAPLRMYLTASILFFLVLKLVGQGQGFNLQIQQPHRDTAVSATQFLQSPAATAVKCHDTVAACGKVKAYLADKYEGKTVAQMGADVRSRVASYAPYAMFIFVPVLAWLLNGIYSQRRMLYGEHLVYSMHLQAFLFFGQTLISVLPDVLVGFVVLWMLMYGWLSLKRVYAGRWWATTIRYALVLLAYPLLLGLAILATLAAAVFF